MWSTNERRIEATLLTDSLTTDSRLTGVLLIIYAFWAVYCNRPPLESGVCGSAAGAAARALPLERPGKSGVNRQARE
jgi:hypothetical protein